MSPDEHDFRKIILSHIKLLETELTLLASTVDAAPIDQRDKLESMHERISNIIGIMKADLLRIS